MSDPVATYLVVLRKTGCVGPHGTRYGWMTLPAENTDLSGHFAVVMPTGPHDIE